MAVALCLFATACAGESSRIAEAMRKGNTEMNAGRFAEAEALYRQALNRARSGKETARFVPVALNNLGELCRRQKKFDEAEALLAEALSAGRNAPREDLGTIASVVNNLGLVYSGRGQYGKAEAFLRQAVDARGRLYGKDNPEYLHSLLNLGNILVNQGRHAEAQPALEEALAGILKIHGEAHPQTANALNGLAFVALRKNRADEAEERFQKASGIWLKTAGETHPDYIQSLVNLADMYESRGDTGRAAEYYRKAAASRRRAGLSDELSLAAALYRVGMRAAAAQKLEEAEGYFDEALGIRLKALGLNHAETKQAAENLLAIYAFRKDEEKAAELKQRLAPNPPSPAPSPVRGEDETAH
jgi:tetratricopeptide (TPR) repeat protein